MESRHFSLPLLVPVIAAMLLMLAIPAEATFAGKNGRIAFVQAAGSGTDIFTMTPNGTEIKQITSFGGSGGQVCCVAWSPDGKQLVFAAKASSSDNAQLWIMRADGSSQHLLLDEPSDFDMEPSFSPDGSQIVFSRCGPINCAIYRVRADGTGLTAITNFNPNHDVFDLWPAYSPDGRKIAFTSFNRNNGFLCAIYMVNADGSNFRLLTPPRLTAFEPDWSPDGTKIAFSVNSNFSTILDEEIWVINADGSQPVRLTNNNRHWNGYLTGPHDFSASWSPKGNKIVLERDSPDFSRSAIYLINPDGSGQTLVFQGMRNKAAEFSRIGGGAPGHLLPERHLKLIESGGFSPRWGPASK
jgi:Tol biopolymer transport system component